MTIRWHIDAESGLTLVTVVGSAGLADIRATLAELHAQPSYRPPMVDLWDLREATLEMEPGEAAELVRHIEGQRGESGTDKTALVVSSATNFGLSRMYQAYAEGRLSLRIEVCTTMAEARAWLGCPEEPCPDS